MRKAEKKDNKNEKANATKDPKHTYVKGRNTTGTSKGNQIKNQKRQQNTTTVKTVRMKNNWKSRDATNNNNKRNTTKEEKGNKMKRGVRSKKDKHKPINRLMRTTMKLKA